MTAYMLSYFEVKAVEDYILEEKMKRANNRHGR